MAKINIHKAKFQIYVKQMVLSFLIQLFNKMVNIFRSCQLLHKCINNNNIWITQQWVIIHTFKDKEEMKLITLVKTDIVMHLKCTHLTHYWKWWVKRVKTSLKEGILQTNKFVSQVVRVTKLELKLLFQRVFYLILRLKERQNMGNEAKVSCQCFLHKVLKCQGRLDLGWVLIDKLKKTTTDFQHRNQVANWLEVDFQLRNKPKVYLEVGSR
jgi:hypothetical protein